MATTTAADTHDRRAKPGHELPRASLLRGGDCVLEVGDDGVRARAERGAKLALVAAGREEE